MDDLGTIGTGAVSDAYQTVTTMHPAELTECEDDALLARSRDGEAAAFGELVRRHQGAALRLAAVIAGSTEEAKDIVQDAFVKTHARIGSYRGTGSVRSWMLRTVANEAKNHVRGRVRRLRRDDRYAALTVHATEGADSVVQRRLEHEQLAAALGRMSSADREVLGCRFLAGLSESETAEVLDVAPGTVKSRTSRALHRLEHALESSSAESSSDGDPR